MFPTPSGFIVMYAPSMPALVQFMYEVRPGVGGFFDFELAVDYETVQGWLKGAKEDGLKIETEVYEGVYCITAIPTSYDRDLVLGAYDGYCAERIERKSNAN